jgi:transposase InsO family protein
LRSQKAVKALVAKAGDIRAVDLVQDDFTADRPNQLWIADFTYVSTWMGFFFVAFVVDMFSRWIVGWRSSRSMSTDFVLGALEQAIHARCPDDGLVHHSDQGSQYLSIRYSERLERVGIQPSVGSVADSYDDALVETIIGLYRAELVNHQGRGRAATSWSS